MQYLVGQMLLCLLGAGLLGLAMGWIWWGMRVRQARERAADFEQRAAKLSGYPSRLTDLEATHAAFVASKNEEDAKCKARIGELEPLAAKVPGLEKSLAAKTTDWEEARKQITGKGNELATLQAKVNELESALKGKDAEIAEHVQAHGDKDARLASLGRRLAEVDAAAKRTPLLEGQLAQHVEAHKEKDEHLEQLMAQVDELTAQVKQHEAAHAEKEAHAGALLSRVEGAEYESNLATRKLRMAESARAVQQVEIGKLNEQILLHKAEIESAKQEEKAVPPKAFAAAAGGAGMGFYDVNEGAASSATQAAAPPEQGPAFEQRIEELRSSGLSKDDEIAKLRSKLSDVEEAPDPDTKRQILFAAKKAELTHLRGVLNSLFQPIGEDEIALRAFCYAQERGFGGGSEMEDWLRAERDSHFNRLAYVWESTRTGTMF